MDIPSSIEHGPDSIILLSDFTGGSQTARAVWLEAGQIRSVALTPELKDKPSSTRGAAYRSLVNVGLGARGLFLALKEDGAGRVVKLSEDGTGLKVIWEFADSVSPHAQSAHFPSISPHARLSPLKMHLPFTLVELTRMDTRTSLEYSGHIPPRYVLISVAVDVHLKLH